MLKYYLVISIITVLVTVILMHLRYIIPNTSFDKLQINQHNEPSQFKCYFYRMFSICGNVKPVCVS